jgi:PIN domain nuclease of toxin-antitoxin system
VGIVKLLLDTCAFLWLATEPTRLSAAAADAIDDETNERFLSDVTLWEISLKHFVGKLPLPEPLRDWIPKQTAFFGLQPLAIDAEAILRSGELADVHRDPFDRLLAAQAIGGAFLFVSVDNVFDDLGVDRLW